MIITYSHAIIYFQEIQHDTKAFKEFIRLEESQFEYIVEALTPIILKEDTYKRECIKPYEMVSLALRYLASGKTLRSLEFQLRIGKKTISQIVTDVCQPISEILLGNSTNDGTFQMAAVLLMETYCNRTAI